MDPARIAAYITPPSGDTSCRLQDAACSPVTADALSGRGADPSLGTRRPFAGSSDPSVLASSLALRLPVSWADDHWGALAQPVVVLRLPASTAGFFFR